MSKQELYRRPADENPIIHKKIPKEPLGISFAIRSNDVFELSMSTFIRQLYLATFVAVLLPVALALNAVLPGIILGYFVFRYLCFTYRSLDPTVTKYVFWTGLLCYFCYYGKMHGLGWVFPALSVFTAFFTLSASLLFKEHWMARASSGLLTQKQRDAFRKDGTLPQGIPREPLWPSLRAAFESWLNYDPANATAPGLQKSPAGPAHCRIAMTMGLSVLWSGVLLTAPVQPPWFLCTLLVVPMFLPLASMAIVAAPSAGAAKGLLDNQPKVTDWQAFTRDIRESENEIAKKSLFLGKVSSDGSPILYPSDLLMHGGWIQGPPGAGKTVMLMQLVEQLIMQGYSVVTLDLKATSHELLGTARRAAERAWREQQRQVPIYPFSTVQGRASHLFSLYDQSFWNALSPEQRASCMIGNFGLNYPCVYPMDWFRDAAWMVQQHVTSKYPNIKSFHEAARLCAEELKHAQDPWELSNQVKQHGEHPRLILQRLGMADAMNVRQTFSQDVLDHSLKLESLFHTPSVLHCSLPAVGDPVTNPEIGRVILNSILHAGAHAKDPSVKVVVLIDEFQRMISRSIDVVLQQGRSSGVGVVLTNQSSADLVAVDANMPGTLSGVTALQAWIKVTEMIGLDQVQRYGGTYIEHMLSKSVQHTENGTNTTYSRQEHELLRCSSGLIDRVNSTPGQYFLRLNGDGGYAAYGGQMMVAEFDYHMSKEEYDKLLKEPWPKASQGMLINGDHRPPNGPPSSALRGPKPPGGGGRRPTPLGSQPRASA